MNIDKMIEDFRLGNIDIDCRRIVLAQDKEGGERYEGKGYIRQNSDGVLVYKLYVAKHENATPHSTLQNYFSHIGKIHPNETFFSLEAEAKDGTKLRASRFFPHASWDMRAGEPEFVSGRLQALTAEPALPQHDHCLELHFFEEHPVPLIEWSEVEECDGKHYVVDSAEFDACGSHFKVNVREGSGRSVVEASADKPFPPDFHWRIQEALQFITGRTATFRALVTCEPGAQQLELISPARLSQRPHFCPPIKHVSMAYRNHGWELFAAYLTYVVESSPATQWNPLAYHLYNAREASANSIDAWAMGVSVALEAVASLVALPDDPEERAEAMRAVQLVKQFVAAEPALKDVKDRLNGLLGMLEQPPGPRARLKWLASQGKVEKAYIERWTDLRNAHVHPKLADFERPDEGTYQTQLDRIHGVQVLLCQVIYHLIGYSGPYTDYAAESYPDKLYPLTVPRSASVG
ncbi:hypothetical protein [Burkholderia cenocepacia]|uniref:hypothetical protein n=1 Tax=Burkholderia cenocepacia TaxID=95486 RepID=UPI00222E1475|nr:hypothetical protein [Burkholderia cenocepacia]MCW3605197.1 hypothetical protein [Burkholderia cenocepacia]MCW5191619.1 hypothetical protein [Burkholderia cenocepacia]